MRCDYKYLSYLSFLIKQLCITIVCLLPRLSFDIMFRTRDPIFAVFIFLKFKVSSVTVFVWLSQLGA